MENILGWFVRHSHWHHIRNMILPIHWIANWRVEVRERNLLWALYKNVVYKVLSSTPTGWLAKPKDSEVHHFCATSFGWKSIGSLKSIHVPRRPFSSWWKKHLYPLHHSSSHCISFTIFQTSEFRSLCHFSRPISLSDFKLGIPDRPDKADFDRIFLKNVKLSNRINYYYAFHLNYGYWNGHFKNDTSVANIHTKQPNPVTFKTKNFF